MRKEPKPHGTKQWIENPPEPGSKVVIVDDVITTGKSAIKAIEQAENNGCTVTAVIVPNDVQSMEAVPEQPHANHTVHTGIGSNRVRPVPITGTTGERRMIFANRFTKPSPGP